MKKTFALIAFAAALAAPLSAQAHRGWLLPSATVLSGTDGWVGVDAGASNGVFVADHASLRLDGLAVTAPDGSTVAPENMAKGRYRSTFDVHLTQQGTYRIASLLAGVTARYKQNGEDKGWRGTAEEFATAIPADATDVEASTYSNRIETFVTLGQPTDSVFVPTGKGLEMTPVTHPNDLVAGEAASFILLKDGQPAANMTITVARGGTRYRDNPEEMTVQTGVDGSFAVTWPEPGMYWLNASARADADGATLASSAQYNGVVEVLP